MAKVEAPFSEDSQDLLEKQVYKGQAKYFVLIYKGVSVVSLILSKKANFDRLITKALGAGLKGSTACGIVLGSSGKLTLQLPGSEAVAASLGLQEFHDEAPVAPAKVKGFLEQHAEFKGTTSFEFVKEVDKLAPVEVPADELKEPKQKPLIQPVDPAVGPQQPPPPMHEDLYNEMLGDVKFDVQRLATSSPKVAAKLAVALAAAEQSAANGDFKSAWERVNKVAIVIAATASVDPNDEANRQANDGIAMRQAPNVDIVLTRVQATVSTMSLAWEKTRLKAIDQIKAAKTNLLKVCEHQLIFAEVEVKSPRLFEISATLDRRLTERLNAAAEAPDRPKMRPDILRSQALVDEYRTYVNQSPLVRALDGAADELKIEPISPFLRKTFDVLTAKLNDAEAAIA